MALAVVHSRAISGMSAPEVTVEVHLANGLPGFALVGLPEAEVKEARERVRAALQNAKFDFPARRITVNMAPADLPKESARFDLPIAIGILAASGQVPAQLLERFEFAGELSLSGELRPIVGALAMTLAVSRSARERQPRGFFLPADNADEAALVGGVAIYPARDLRQVVAHLESLAGNTQAAPIREYFAQVRLSPPAYPDFFDVKGQSVAKRALEIAAIGGHSVLMVGPPGTGKTMLAQRFPGLLPPMGVDEALESAAVLSLVGKFAPQRWATRVFRAPHHSASAPALVGGGANAAPRRNLARASRRAVSRRIARVRSARPGGHARTAGNRPHHGRARGAPRGVSGPLPAHRGHEPLPCGYHGHPSIACRCTPEMVSRYQDRISGPLLDRIDMRVEVTGAEPGGAHRPARWRAVALCGRPRRAGARPIHRAPGQGQRRARLVRDRTASAGPRARCASCCTPPAPASAGRRAPITACSRWRARSPTSKGSRRSRAGTSPSRSSTGARCARPEVRGGAARGGAPLRR